MNDEWKNAIKTSDFYKDLVKIFGGLPRGSYNLYVLIHTEYSGLQESSVLNFDEDNQNILNEEGSLGEVNKGNGYLIYHQFVFWLDNRLGSSTLSDMGALVNPWFNTIYL